MTFSSTCPVEGNGEDFEYCDYNNTCGQSQQQRGQQQPQQPFVDFMSDWEDKFDSLFDSIIVSDLDEVPVVGIDSITSYRDSNTTSGAVSGGGGGCEVEVEVEGHSAYPPTRSSFDSVPAQGKSTTGGSETPSIQVRTKVPSSKRQVTDTLDVVGLNIVDDGQVSSATSDTSVSDSTTIQRSIDGRRNKRRRVSTCNLDPLPAFPPTVTTNKNKNKNIEKDQDHSALSTTTSTPSSVPMQQTSPLDYMDYASNEQDDRFGHGVFNIPPVPRAMVVEDSSSTSSGSGNGNGDGSSISVDGNGDDDNDNGGCYDDIDIGRYEDYCDVDDDNDNDSDHDDGLLCHIQVDSRGDDLLGMLLPPIQARPSTANKPSSINIEPRLPQKQGNEKEEHHHQHDEDEEVVNCRSKAGDDATVSPTATAAVASPAGPSNARDKTESSSKDDVPHQQDGVGCAQQVIDVDTDNDGKDTIPPEITSPTPTVVDIVDVDDTTFGKPAALTTTTTIVAKHLTPPEDNPTRVNAVVQADETSIPKTSFKHRAVSADSVSAAALPTATATALPPTTTSVTAAKVETTMSSPTLVASMSRQTDTRACGACISDATPVPADSTSISIHGTTVKRFPPSYELRGYDIVSGRHKLAFNHFANRRFRVTISIFLPRYLKAKGRVQRSKLIIQIVQIIKDAGGYFLKPDAQHAGGWIEMSSKEARNKVGHALRDAASAATPEAKNAMEKELTLKEQQQQQRSQTQKQKQQNDKEQADTNGVATPGTVAKGKGKKTRAIKKSTSGKKIKSVQIPSKKEDTVAVPVEVISDEVSADSSQQLGTTEAAATTTTTMSLAKNSSVPVAKNDETTKRDEKGERQTTGITQSQKVPSQPTTNTATAGIARLVEPAAVNASNTPSATSLLSSATEVSTSRIMEVDSSKSETRPPVSEVVGISRLNERKRPFSGPVIVLATNSTAAAEEDDGGNDSTKSSPMMAGTKDESSPTVSTQSNDKNTNKKRRRVCNFLRPPMMKTNLGCSKDGTCSGTVQQQRRISESSTILKSDMSLLEETDYLVKYKRFGLCG